MLMFSSFSQTADKMLKHSGETVEVKIIKVGETTISYSYPGEENISIDANIDNIIVFIFYFWFRAQK